MHYTIVKGEGHYISQASDALERAVNVKLKEDYVPSGSIILTEFEAEGERVVSQKVKKIMLLQPMLKTKEDPGAPLPILGNK